MYIIRDLKTNQYFCYKHNSIIVFKDVTEADNFIQLFFQYAMTRAMNEDPQLIFEVMALQNNLHIEEKPESISNTINFDIIKKERDR